MKSQPQSKIDAAQLLGWSWEPTAPNSREDIAAYFSPENLRAMFGDDALEGVQDWPWTLEEIADAAWEGCLAMLAE